MGEVKSDATFSALEQLQARRIAELEAALRNERTPTSVGPDSGATRDELWLSSKVGDWIWRELNAGRFVAAVTRELADRVKEMEARRVAA